ncbi:MAG: septum site-determining protein MinC [Clostridia bacterium]|nr:septum site-determining protein MinC [Clostridia bacterium]
MIEAVTFKLTKDGLRIVLDDNLDFASIRRLLKKKLEESKDFFQGARLKTVIQGRDLEKHEFDELCKIINEETGFYEIEEEVTTFDWKQNIAEGKTKFYRGTMRSGSLIDYKGNVVVMGDVNPGAEIIATGNIVVMGVIKGTVHAGAKGNRNAIVSASGIYPTQLRIADLITVSPNEKEVEKLSGFETAYIKENHIYIE